MKLRNTLLFALAFSAAPVAQTSADMSLSISTPHTFGTPLLKMSQTTQNVLVGVGVGVVIAGIGYLVWKTCIRKVTDMEFLEELAPDIHSIRRRYMGMPDDLPAITPESADFFANSNNAGIALTNALEQVGREAEPQSSSFFKKIFPSDDEYMGQFCIKNEQAYLRGAAIVGKDLKYLQEQERKLLERMEGLKQCPDKTSQAMAEKLDILHVELNSVRALLGKIVNICNSSPTFRAYKQTYQKDLRNERNEQEANRNRQRIALAQERHNDLTEERNEIERKKLASSTH